jgi:hypothetical protein
MSLSSEALKYCDVLFRGKREILLREFDQDRVKVWRGLIHREDVEKHAGYLGALQPEVDLAKRLARARADAMRESYEWDNQTLTDENIGDILMAVGWEFEGSFTVLVSEEQQRMDDLQTSNKGSFTSAQGNLNVLTELMHRSVRDTTDSIRNDMNLKALEEKKNKRQRGPTMKISELSSRIEKFRTELDEHADLWGQSLDHTIPEYPIRNREKLRLQYDGLARQLGMLRPFFGKLGLPTIMGNSYIGQWDAFDSAVSDDVAPRKGQSIQAVLSQLQQALGKLDSMDPDSEFGLERNKEQHTIPQNVTIYNLQGAQSRVNIQSNDHSTNVSSITEKQLFSEIRNAVEQNVPDGPGLKDILAKLDDLETAKHSDRFSSRYQAFINAAAAHITVVAPFIPALTQMLNR